MHNSSFMTQLDDNEFERAGDLVQSQWEGTSHKQ